MDMSIFSCVYLMFILCHMISILIKALKFRRYSLEKCYTFHLKAPEKCYKCLD